MPQRESCEMFQTNVSRQYEDISTDEEEFKKFLKRLEILRATYPEELSILKPNQTLCMIRIQTLLDSTSEEKFLKINECLKILKQTSLKEVAYLTIEVNKFEGTINKRLGEEFIKNLQSLNEIGSIQVVNIQKTHYDPYSFLLFMSYQPTQVGQVFVFTSKANGRLLILQTELDKTMVVKQFINFNDANMNRRDELAAEEIKQLNDSIWNISNEDSNYNEKQQGNQEINQQPQQNEEQLNLLELSIVFDLQNSTLRKQFENLMSLLKLIDKNSKQLKSISMSFQDNVTKRQQQQSKSQNDPINKEEADFFLEDSDQFLIDFNNLQLTSKLTLILRVENAIDATLVANLAKNIQNLQIEMQGQESYDIDLNNIAAEIQRIQNRTQTNSYCHKFKSLELKQSQRVNTSLSSSFILAESLKHLTKVSFKNRTNQQQISFFEKQNTKIAAHILNSCEEINYEDQLLLQGRFFLTLKTTKISFNEENESHLAALFMLITKPVFLAIQDLWGLSKPKMYWVYKFISQIAMNPCILSIKMDTNNDPLNKQFRQVIDEMKRYYLYLIAFEKIFSDLMICNPKLATFDIISLDG